MNKKRESEVPFNKINIAHDLTKQQKEELLRKKLKRHKKRKRMTSQGNGYSMCEVHHGIGSSKEFPKEQFERNPERKVKKKSIRSLPKRSMNRNTTKKTAALLLTK